MVDYLLSGQIVNTITDLMHTLHNASFGIVRALIIMVFIYHAIKLLSGKGNISDMPIVKMFGILFLFFTYEFWTIALGKVIVALANQVYNPETSNPFEPFFQLFSQSDVDFSFWNVVTGGYSLEALIVLVSCIIIIIASSVFTTVQVLLQAFLYVSGPFAIVMSLIPIYSSALTSWFKNFISTCLWSVFYAMFLKLFLTLSKAILTDNNNSVAELFFSTNSVVVTTLSSVGLEVSIKLLALSILSLIGIVLIPSIASKIIPDAGIGGVGSMFSGLGSISALTGAGAVAKLAGKKAMGKTGQGFKSLKGSIGGGGSAIKTPKFAGNNPTANPVSAAKPSSSNTGASPLSPNYFSSGSPSPNPSASTSSASPSAKASQSSSSSTSSDNGNTTRASAAPSDSSAKTTSKSSASSAKEVFTDSKSKRDDFFTKNSGSYTEPVEEPKQDRPSPKYPPNHKYPKK